MMNSFILIRSSDVMCLWSIWVPSFQGDTMGYIVFHLEMAHSDNNALSSAFKTFFERETLTGPNFNEWHRSLRIVLRFEFIPQNLLAELEKCLRTSCVADLDMVDTLHSCNRPLVNLSLNKDFGDFVRNFNMHCVGKTGSSLAPLPHDWAIGRGELPLYLEELRANKKSLSIIMEIKTIVTFAPSIVRGVVSFSCLLDLGFKHTVASNGISVSLNGVFYFSAISVNGAMDEEMKSMKVNQRLDCSTHLKLVWWLNGCTQTYGIDTRETFSPVEDIRDISDFIAFAAYFMIMRFRQMDVKIAFLIGRLDEDYLYGAT
ncbi:hypothetical protein Tco_1344417 [Tanacetum coccineum]